MKIMKFAHLRRCSAFIALIAVVSAILFAGSAMASSTVQPKEINIQQKSVSKSILHDAANSAQTAASSVNVIKRYIVTLLDDSVARYRGGVNGYDATSTQGHAKLNVASGSALAYTNYLVSQQEQLLAAMENALGRTIVPISKLQVAINALVVELTPAEAKIIAQLSGVRSVQPDQTFKLKSTTTYDGYAQSSSYSAQPVRLPVPLLAAAILALFGLLWLAYRRGWLGRRTALLVAVASAIVLVGCHERYYKLEGGFEWIGAPDVWRGTEQTKPTKGEGIVVGVLDSGINPISDSFAEVAGDGYEHKNPRNKFYGICDPKSSVYDKTFPCNNKLIGAWGSPTLDDGGARDYDGHGSHTAGTSAGNLVYDATFHTPTGYTLSKTIAGVAPRANIIAYKVCGNLVVSCAATDVVAAINQAIIDGVDVINFSVGFNAWNPWDSNIAMGFLSALDAGIFVAVSASNNGPLAATLAGPADAPWVTTVAASSHNLFYRNDLVSMRNAQGERLDDITGQALTIGYGPAAIVDAADYGNALCLKDKFNARFNGEIVLCDAGEILRVDKGKNVKANGGGALILTRKPKTADGSGYLEADAHYIPATHITYSDASKLRQWLAKGSGHKGKISGTEPMLNFRTADVLAYFSSRGPDLTAPDMVKPNLTAPGRAVFAAYDEGESDAEQDYQIIQGTSMSSPHVAGSGALLKALHPSWTPMQIQSALMTTADVHHYKEDGVTQANPFEMGAGRIDLPVAARAALLLDENGDNFKAANPGTGGDPKTLNLSSLGDSSCVVSCTWTRTVTNVSNRSAAWSASSSERVQVTPAAFTLAAGASAQLTFTADVADTKVGDWLFDQVYLRSNTATVPDAHLPMAALASASTLPGALNIKAEKTADVVTLSNIKAVELTDTNVAISGLVPATVYQGAAVSDPTNKDPYDAGFDPEKDGQQLFLLDIPAGTARLVVETTASKSPDLDLYVGRGEQPSRETFLQASTTFTAIEYVNIAQPPEGKIWVVVQNWEPGFTEPAEFTLQVGIVAATDSGNLTADVPLSNPAGELFDMKLNFNLPNSVAGNRFYGVVALGTDSDHPANLGTVMIDLVRQ